MSDQIGFVVKMSSSSGMLIWVSPPTDGFHPILGSRDNAEVFSTREDAHAAIGRMPIAFQNAAFLFTIEPADD
jgi:hypothetical protein